MAIIRIYQGKTKPTNKKPGWREAEAQHAEWLAKIQRMQLFANAPPPTKRPATRTPVSASPQPCKLPSRDTPGGGGTKPVARPDILYKDDPEMLARELKARERRFTTAPAYNKGGAVLITDEMMKDITAGKTRRR